MRRQVKSYCYAFYHRTWIHTRWVSYTLEQLATFFIITVLLVAAMFVPPFSWIYESLGEWGFLWPTVLPLLITGYITTKVRRDGMPLLDWMMAQKDYWRMADEFEPLTFEPVEEGEMEIKWWKGEKG